MGAEAALCSPIEEWFTDRATMQAFGTKSELQKQILSEVKARSSTSLYKIVEKLLEPNENFRLSAKGLRRMLEGIRSFEGVSMEDVSKVKLLGKQIGALLDKYPEHISGPLS